MARVLANWVVQLLPYISAKMSFVQIIFVFLVIFISQSIVRQFIFLSEATVHIYGKRKKWIGKHIHVPPIEV